MLCLSSPLYLAQDSVHGRVPPTVKVNLPTSVDLIKLPLTGVLRDLSPK